jgi:hypothetical protein
MYGDYAQYAQVPASNTGDLQVRDLLAKLLDHGRTRPVNFS